MNLFVTVDEILDIFVVLRYLNSRCIRCFMILYTHIHSTHVRYTHTALHSHTLMSNFTCLSSAQVMYQSIIDEYRIKKTLKGRLQKKNNPLKVFDHQIHQKLATDVIGVSFDAQ